MKFIFSGTMLRFVDYSHEVEISEPNFELALKGLLAKAPALEGVLLDSNKNLRRTHQMFLNGESMEARYYSDAQARNALAVQPTDSVYFLTAIAGG
ncbi:MoaD/ThiS family protein [Hyalangium sp.]|uniref:MoaD/ThiS family protein n=1 Tax=Hyalangium sp. TaxID=2028555 RepID=UPI002D65B997|nr:MoaD/ThiS family protein [Hyalangium sp.]HYH97663.1 MoaD/ThiS family protein [Hyalangium sp.]